MMRLNLPFFDQIKDCERILIAGAGGGFDVYAGLPIFHELYEQGRTVYLANYSFTDLYNASCERGYKEAPAIYSFGGKVTKCPTRAATEANPAQQYFPEGYLAEFLSQRGYDSRASLLYAFPKCGVAPIRDAYRQLVKQLDLDAIILVDGGIDSIMTGKEEGCATILEDTVSLAAVRDVDVKVKILATIGFGTEVSDGLNHYRALENMAALTKAGALLGSCCLTPDMGSFHFLKEAYSYVSGKKSHAQSHITPGIIKGGSGDFLYSYHTGPGKHDFKPMGLECPLTSIYWFWSPNMVASRNVLIDSLFCQTATFTDVNVVYRARTPENKKDNHDLIL
jgi:hypothetical protein